MEYKIRNKIDLELLDEAMRELGLKWEVYERPPVEWSNNFVGQSYVQLREYVIFVDLAPLQELYEIDWEEVMSDFLLRLEEKSGGR